MTPSKLGGGLFGWIAFVLLWTGIIVFLPIIVIGWFIIIAAAFAGLGSLGGD